MELKRFEAKLDGSCFMEYTPEGFLKLDAVITRSGVFDYPEYGRREYRPADEVFKQESMDSLLGKSITFLHPSEMIDTKNVKKYEVGTVIGPVTRVDNFIKARMLFKDPDTIAYIERSKTMKEDVKLSAGYYNVDDIVAGEHEGEKYDRIQREISYNHVALVAEGRAGKEARIVLDHKVNGNNGGTSMKKKLLAVKCDGVVDLPELNIDTDKPEEIVTATSARLDAVTEALTKQGVVITEQKKTIAEMQTKMDADKAEKAELQKKLDAALDINGEQFAAGVTLRKSLEETAEALEVKMDGVKTVKEQKVLIVEKAFGKKMDGKSDEYINAMFDSAVEMVNTKKNAENAEALAGGKVVGKKKDEKEPTPQDRYNAVHEAANAVTTK